MSLEQYKKKRNFRKTPEPIGRSGQNSDILSFVVQEHHASHLHYDFRLEIDGTLKSWAVPKGPPLKIGEKRLAIHVEDHPLEYGKFEGTIPAGNYGAGEVFIWDQGTYRAQDARYGYKKGHLMFELFGNRLRGEYSLVKTKDNQWLFIKHADMDKITTAPFPQEFKPMLATLAPEPFDGPEWIFETKWDGYRAIARIQKRKVDLHSRNLNSFNADYPSIVKELEKIKHDVILDGEIIAYDKTGKATFQSIQNLTNGTRLEYVIFDLLYIDGIELFDQPLIKRKEILKELIPRSKIILYSEHKEKDGKKYFEQAKKDGLEGIIAKKKDSKYIRGQRSENWLKIKHHQTDEALIAGFTEPRGSRKLFGALVLGQLKENELVFIGHTGTGFSGKTLENLHEQMTPLIRKSSPFKEKVPLNAPITWIEPKLIAELKFMEWTSDGRMRHPVYLGLRPDKDPEEVTEQKKTSKTQPALSNLNKIYFPKLSLTKGDVVSYYSKVARYILPYLAGRPESLNRHPNGIDKPNFFQKNITNSVPDFVKTIRVKSESKGSINYLVCDNKETLLYIANLGCIEINPWSSHVENLDRPDYMIIDLDPGDNTWAELVKVAKEVKKILDLACEKSYLKTSGKRGLHILVPFGGRYSFDEIRVFSEFLVQLVHRSLPEITSVERSPAKRKKLIYLDYLQNRRGQTIAAPYSLRPTKEATVSTPIEWKELTPDLDIKKFNINTIESRLKRKGDIWKNLLVEKTSLKESIECLRQALGKNIK
jgi:bifunctional non-homologous end joining protein LigD